MEGVRLTGDELIREYGISRRLAVRIGALAARGLTVTPTLLEIAGAGSSVEKLLLHPDLLDRADALDTEAVAEIARAAGAEEEGPMAVVQGETSRVLALQEELLAEQGWTENAPGEAVGLIKSEIGLPAAGVLDRGEREHLFTPEEIARLKLDALAGENVEARVSALRKLRYAPLPAREKGAVYLRVLVDPAGPVRTEAIKALESLGFNRDTADALQRVFGDDPEASRKAVRRIGDMIGGLQPAEREIVLVVLIERFREERPSGEDDPLLRVLTESVPLIGADTNLAREVTRIAVQHLAADFEKANQQLGDMLLSLAGKAPEPVVEKLREQVGTIRDPEPRAFLIGLLIELETDAGRRTRLCDTVLDELLGGGHDELTRQKLGHRMTALGAPMVEAILHRYKRASNADRATLVPFMDALHLDESLPAESRAPLAAALVRSLKMADRPLRLAILRTRTLNREDLALPLKKALVTELLPVLRYAESPELTERTMLMLEMLGETAVKGLFDAVRSRPASSEADHAVRALARILSRPDRSPAATKTAKKILDFAAERVKRPRNRAGGYAEALGRLAAAGVGGATAARKAFTLLVERMPRCAYAEDVVAALGRLAASPLVKARQRVEAVHLLSGLVERPADEEETSMRRIVTDKGPVYEIGGRVDFDSATLPAAVEGLERIALCSHATDALRRRIADVFLRVWRSVADWSVIWGPRSSERLARALGAIGADARTDDDTRVTILDALARGIERLSVLKALGGLLDVRTNARTFNTRAVTVANRILEQWVEPEIAPGELETVVRVAAIVAARPEINSRTKAARELRKRVLELLFDALRNGSDWATAPLEKMRDSAAMPKNLREEIAHRLEQAFVIVPSGN